MSIQYSTTHRTNEMTTLITDIGTSAQIIIYTGSAPATVGTAATGTALVQFAGNATQFGTATSGVLTASAIASANATGSGTAGYYRINTSGAVAVAQGSVFQSSTLTTNAATAANSNVLTFAAVSGVAAGQLVTGTGIGTNTTVLAFTSTTVTLSLASTAGVASATAITFSGDMVLGNTNIASGQSCNFNSLTVTASGA